LKFVLSQFTKKTTGLTKWQAAKAHALAWSRICR